MPVKERREAAGTVQRQHVLKTTNVVLADKNLRDAGASCGVAHVLTGFGVEIDADLAIIEAALGQEVLGSNAVTAVGTGVEGDVVHGAMVD